MSTRAIFPRLGVGAIGPWIAAVVFIMAAADISPVGAQSTETLRVSTLDETASRQIGVTPNQRYTQSFCTGNSSATLTKVRLPTRSSGPDPSPSVTIRAEMSGEPGETIDTLTNPTTFDDSISTYEDFTGSGLEFAANAHCWLVLSVQGPLTLSVTQSHNESAAEAGWSIGDKIFYGGNGGWQPAFVPTKRPDDFRMRMAVYASGDAPSAAPPAFACTATAAPLTMEVNENAATSTIVGTMSATDPDNDSLTYSVSGTDAAKFDGVFSMSSNTGEISVKPGASPNYEEERSYSISVNVTDGKDASVNAESPAVTDDSVAVTVRVVNIDEPGTITLSPQLPIVNNRLNASLTDQGSFLKVVMTYYDGASGPRDKYGRLITNSSDPTRDRRSLEAISNNAVAMGGM